VQYGDVPLPLKVKRQKNNISHVNEEEQLISWKIYESCIPRYEERYIWKWQRVYI